MPPAADSGSRGKFAFTIAGKEICHPGDHHAAHFFFSRETRLELIRPDRSPGTRCSVRGPAARRVERDEDVREVIP